MDRNDPPFTALIAASWARPTATYSSKSGSGIWSRVYCHGQSLREF